MHLVKIIYLVSCAIYNVKVVVFSILIFVTQQSKEVNIIITNTAFILIKHFITQI